MKVSVLIKMLRDKNTEKSERVMKALLQMKKLDIKRWSKRISNDKVANAWGPCTGIVWTKSFTLKFQRKGPDLTSWSTLESVRRKRYAIHADVLLRREAVGKDSRITARRDHAGVRRVRAEPRQYRSLGDGGEATVELDRHHDSRQEWQAHHHRRTFRRNQGTARRLPPDRVQRPRRGDFNREAHSDDSLWRDDRGASSACRG